jgi:hypothetical protein
VEAQPKNPGEAGHVWQAYEDKDGSGWAGAEQGVRSNAWYSMGTPGK